jgi:hypothetical protein
VIEAELVDCGKSAFVGEESIVDAEFAYLRNNYIRQQFQRGPVGHAGQFSGWSFEQPGYSPMPRILKQFVEGGIYGFLVKINRMLDYLKRGEGTNNIIRGKFTKFGKYSSVRALDLNGSLQTIFILLASFLASSLLVMFGEIVFFKFIFECPSFSSQVKEFEM